MPFLLSLWVDRSGLADWRIGGLRKEQRGEQHDDRPQEQGQQGDGPRHLPLLLVGGGGVRKNGFIIALYPSSLP
jgi:hypothetical protein